MSAQQKPTTDDLVARCRQMADKAHNDGNRARPGADELENFPTEPSNPFTVIEGDNLPPDPDDRFAGSDADALFDIGEFGEGRTCGACGDPLEGQRADARFCCDACRVTGWRTNRKGPHAHEG